MSLRVESRVDVNMMSSHIGDQHSVGDSATPLYINEGLIRPAKVAVIARGHLTLFVLGLVLCFGSLRL